MTSVDPEPERQDAIRELVRLLRTGYAAYLESLKAQTEVDAKPVESKHT